MINKYYIPILLLFLCLNTGPIPFAHSQPSSGNTILLNVDNVLEGLIVEKFHVDSKQKLWIKTERGINFVDNNDQQLYRYGKGENQIHSRNKLAFFKEKDENICLFYQKEGGFYDLWDRRSQTWEKTSIPSHPKTVNFSFQYWIKDKSDDLWAFYSNDDLHLLYNIQDDLTIQFELEDKIIKLISGNDHFWIMTDKNQVLGLNRNGQLNSVPLVDKLEKSNSFIDQILHIFYEDQQGVLWISYRYKKGLFFKEKNQTRIREYKTQYNQQSFTKVWEDKQGRLLFVTSNSQRYVKAYYIMESNRLGLKAWDYLSKVDKVPTDVISSDFYKEIFMGTYRGMKIIRLKKDFVNNVLNDPDVTAGDYGNTIMSVCQVNDSTMLLVDEKKSLYLLDSKKPKIIDTINPEVKELFHLVSGIFDAKNQVFHGHIHTGKRHKSGLISFDFSTKTTKTHKIDIKISAIHLGNSGNIIIAGYNDFQKAILEYDPVKFTIKQLVTIKDSTKREHRIRALYLDQKTQKLWFAKDYYGLYVYDFSTDNHNITDLQEEIVYNHINQKKDRTMLVSTMSGLYFVDQHGKDYELLDERSGMGNSSVCFAQEDPYGSIWASTFSGLFRYTSRDIYGTISMDDGLAFSEFNQRAGNIDQLGTMYFGGANGLSIIEPEIYATYQRNISTEYIKLKDNYQNETLFDFSNELQLHQDKTNEITIKLSNSKWSINDDFSYYYKLDDQNWKSATNDIIFLEHFETGKNRIEIKGLSRMGLPSFNTISIPFRVYEKFWERTVAHLFLGSLLLLGLALFVFKYYENIRTRKLENEIAQNKKMAAFELEALRSQLNPHFVFNAMGAIQHFIGKKDTQEAQVYLADFSKLMRLFLESSKVKFVTLENELEMLKLYISLENLRFDNAFDSSFLIDSDIQPDQYLIPSLLIQPFVENAINHGLSHKKDSGLLTISVEKISAEEWMISIQDNGVGRAKSKAIYSNSLHKHKSRGMELVNNRIELLANTQNYDVRIDNEDLYDENGIAKGLKVNIFIPFLLDD